MTLPEARPSLRRRLLEGELSVGPFLKIPAPEVTELVGLSGFDHVVIDLEHSQFTLATAVDSARAAMARGVHPVVRTADRSAAELVHALDLGASGLIVPHVGSAEDAAEVVRDTRFHPIGARGMDIYARAAGWGATPRDEYLRRSNEDIVIGLMIEGSVVIDRLEDIAAVDGVDLLFIGPYDLSQSLGVPGQVEHPKVTAAIEGVVSTARSHHKAVGMYVDSVAMAKRVIDLGVQFIGMANDADILRRAFSEMRDSVHAERSII